MEEVSIVLWRNNNSIKKEYQCESVSFFMKTVTVFQKGRVIAKYDLDKVDYYEVKISGENLESEEL
jgi:hypothetical protein